MQVTIIGRRWFQRSYGNTYHSAEVIIDGQTAFNTGIHYGYDQQYLETALSMAESKGLIPARIRHKNTGGFTELLSDYAKRNDIDLAYRALDVAREKDL